ncbi:MAG: hypothetical protein WCD04_09045, partial [Terriglobia bacterium]
YGGVKPPLRLFPQPGKPWEEWPHPLLFLLPRLAGEGAGGEGRTQDPRLSPWATLFRPGKSGLTYAMNFSYGTRTGLRPSPTSMFSPRSGGG